MSTINQITVGSTTYDIEDMNAVPSSRTVNGLALSSNITLEGNNIRTTIWDTDPNVDQPFYIDDELRDINNLINILVSQQVPNSRTINGHALSSNITLTASDVSAASTSDVTNITELKFTSGFTVTWTASSPHSTDTNSVYPNRGAIALTGVTASMYPQVTFGVANAISGNYSPICECYAGGVYIWSKNTTTPTISSILVHK